MSSFIFHQILQVYRGLAMPAGSVTRRNLALFPLNISFNIISQFLCLLFSWNLATFGKTMLQTIRTTAKRILKCFNQKSKPLQVASLEIRIYMYT